MDFVQSYKVMENLLTFPKICVMILKLSQRAASADDVRRSCSFEKSAVFENIF